MDAFLARRLTSFVKYNTNLYRGGELNLPTRMQNILGMSPQPDFVEIISWV